STGVAAAREGGLRGTLTDLEIQAAINDLWFQYDIKTFAKLDMTVNQGRVLITGVVQNPEDRVEAVRLAWQPEGVRQVINEIQLADSPGMVDYARDAWISTRLRTALTFDSKVQSINYSIDVVKGIVYLMGVAQNEVELNHVIEKARTIPDVKRVVSYVKIAGEDIGPTQGGNAV
ncbi:MAG: BON domain-containing protein, partial [Alphaproteobacteria bacterium]|nr:BON domain-containing protein [Alphaproteobacteria bacterium]